jgi:hypothetical protein
MRDQVGGVADDDVVLVLHGRPHWRTGARTVIHEPDPGIGTPP